MAGPTSLVNKLSGSVRQIREHYAGDTDQPLGGYVATMSVYSTVVAILAGAAALTGREIPDGLDPKEVVLTAAATHKLSRLLARDPVTSPLRAPFTSYEGTSGPAELSEDVRGVGAQKAVGELITCPFCTGVWVATGLTAGLVFLPKLTRLAIDAFAALAGADMLQFVHAWLLKKTS